MDYVILDLEWDTAYSKKHGRFVNQIIQIGAVKLDKEFNVLSVFKQTISSQIQKKVTKRFTELTGITTEEMQVGIPYEKALEKYNKWCGKDIITITWSNSDLFTIIDNNRLFLDEGNSMYIGRYVDLQSYVQNELRLKGEKVANQISLSNAAEFFNISTESYDLHTALDDSRITAAILEVSYVEGRFGEFIKDTENPEFFKKLTFKNQYISSISDKRITKKNLEFVCEKCNAIAIPGKKWRYKNRWFTNDFCCPNCNEKFIGKVMFKVTYSGVKVAKRALLPKLKVEENETVMQ